MKFQACDNTGRFVSDLFGPVRKPHCWFSHEAAQIFKYQLHQLSPLFVLKRNTKGVKKVRGKVPACPYFVYQLN